MRGGSLATLAAVARFCGVKREDVRRWIEEDGLPKVALPGPQREIPKIDLHELQQWMAGRTTKPSGESLKMFMKRFWEVQPAAADREDEPEQKEAA